MLRLVLAGGVEAVYAGAPLRTPSNERARALVGWLGLHPGMHPRSQVAGALWPDADEAQRRARLRTTLWSLRQDWGPASDEVLLGSRDSLGLAQASVDVLEAVDGLPLPDGELLPGVEDEWAVQEREAYRRRQLDRYGALASAATASGRTGEAVTWSRRRAELARWDEPAHRALVRALVADGDRAGAADEVRTFTARLRADLGLAPSAPTRALHASATTDGHAARSGPEPQVFGRAAELRALAEQWREAAAGRGRMVVLSGEPGIGKTTVIAALAARVAARGAVVGRATGLDVGGSMPYGVWLDLATDLATCLTPDQSTPGRSTPDQSTPGRSTPGRSPATSDGGPWRAELARLSPRLGALLGRAPAPGPVDPDLQRLRIVEASLALVEQVAAQRPVLLVVDDAHRADAATVQLLAQLARRVSRQPVLLLLARPDRPAVELDGLAASAARTGLPVNQLVLAPLEPDAVAALATSLGAPDVDRVVGSSEGNPLLAVETARAMRAGQSGPPPNLRTAVRAAVSRLGPGGRTLSGVLAAAGRSLSGAELARLGPLVDEDAVNDVLDSGLVVRTAGRLGFRHGLLRSAAYVDLPDPAALHAVLAPAVDPSLSAEVAAHWEAAGRPEDAATAWRQVATYARSVGALEEAADALAKATRAAPAHARAWLDLQEVSAYLGRRDVEQQAWSAALRLLPPDERAAAWCRRGDQLRSVLCDPPRSLAAYREAQAERAASGRDGGRTALDQRIDIGLAWHEAVVGDPLAAVRSLDELATEAGDLAPVALRLDLVQIAIQGLIRQGRFRAAADRARAAQPLMGTAAASDRSFAIASNGATAMLAAGQDEAALEFARTAVEETREIPVRLVDTLGSLAHLLARTGRVEQAEATLAEQSAVATRLDTARALTSAASDAGLVHLSLGRLDEAQEELGRALDGGITRWRAALALSRAEAMARLGDPEGAQAQLRSALQEPMSAADQPWTSLPRVSHVQGLIALARGDHARAMVLLEEAADAWRALLPRSVELSTEDYRANLLDLGRPVVMGLVEPARELARVRDQIAALRAPRQEDDRADV